jgi:hypothetical protein
MLSATQLCVALHGAPSVRMTLASPGLAAHCDTTWTPNRPLGRAPIARLMQSGHVHARSPLIRPAAVAKQCSIAAPCMRGGVMDR